MPRRLSPRPGHPPRRSEYTLVLATDARLIAEWLVEGGEVTKFKVRREAEEAGEWWNVELYDCSHSGRNDRHRYSREGLKGPPKNFHGGTAGEALRIALELIQGDFERMIEQWRH